MKKYKYRKKDVFWTSAKDSDWNSCTEDEKARIEKMSPRKFVFVENEKPPPTPSMEASTKKKEKKED